MTKFVVVLELSVSQGSLLPVYVEMSTLLDRGPRRPVDNERVVVVVVMIPVTVPLLKWP